MKRLKSTLPVALAIGALFLGPLTLSQLDARPGGGGRGAGMSGGRNMQVRSGSASSVNWSNRSVSTSHNVNRDVNRQVSRDVNVDIDHDYHWGDHYHPVARAATATAVTAAVVGSYYRYLPANCATIYRGTVIYYQCGTAWYQPVYSGTSVQYVVVTAP